MTTPTVMDLQHDLTNMLGKLEALGSEQQIADYFTQENITGEHLHPFRCPVAQFLHRELSGADAFVAAMFVSFAVGRVGRVVDTPPAVSAFVISFDEGDYPELETKGSMSQR